MRIPSKQACYRLMCAAAMPEHIVVHSIQVSRVAGLIGTALVAKGRPLNLDLLRAGSLLHDITKMRSLQTGENHARSGAAMLAKMGFEAVADIVRQHVELDRAVRKAPVGEAHMLNYADKRVRHDRIVSMARRMAYIRDVYGRTEQERQRIARLWDDSRKLERRIFEPLGFGPGQVGAQLPAATLSAALAAYRRVCPMVTAKKVPTPSTRL